MSIFRAQKILIAPLWNIQRIGSGMLAKNFNVSIKTSEKRLTKLWKTWNKAVSTISSKWWVDKNKDANQTFNKSRALWTTHWSKWGNHCPNTRSNAKNQKVDFQIWCPTFPSKCKNLSVINLKPVTSLMIASWN